MAPQTASEIEQALGATLARRGVGGAIVVRDGAVELHGAGPVVAIELGDLGAQWPLLPPDIRDRRIELCADRLRSALTQALPPPAEPIALGPWLRKAGRAAIVVALIAGPLWWLWRARFFGSSPPPAPSAAKTSAPAAAAVDPAAYGHDHCEAARRRLYSGGSMDLEPIGWTVELWLARDSNKAPLWAEPALKPLAGDKLAGRLGAMLPAGASWLGGNNGTRASLRFEGGFLRPFFQADGRDRFVALVDEVADAVDADQAALFARCEHSSIRDIGAYFRGRDAPGAVAALLFAQGLFSEPRIVDRGKLAGAKGQLAALRKAAEPIEPAALDELIRDSGGRMVSRDAGSGHPFVGFVFSLGGPLRAQQAARALAKQLHVD